MQKKRGRRPIIPPSFYSYDFESMAKKEKVAFMRVKLLALEQIKQGKGYREVARSFCVDETAIKKWVVRVVSQGPAGLRVAPGRGRKCKLKKCKIDEFKTAIQELQNKRNGGRINVADITAMANEKFGTNYKVKGMYSFLHSINMVWISARSKHPVHSQEAQDSFKKTL